MNDRGRFVGLRRFQIIEPIASPKALVVVVLNGYFNLNILVVEHVGKVSKSSGIIGVS
ncbi:hypothetical protein C8R30_12226 [Nitrosomonas nitrosa]|uniref:Uncharacterized protein n=1 Tax=Nitrosomonas nitrosa TaxID=52442 RepID=A0A1I4TMK9_9PROT|nr:hypothetical protein C8R30_12226 [Nitrosomonas nitrosa]SFM77959.1 hypothetical protein SAMN05421880_13315 [Nitrosomonas nitrosa]